MEKENALNDIDDNRERIINKGEITRDDLVKVTRVNSIRGGLSFSIIGFVILLAGIVLLVTTLNNNYDASFLPYVLMPCGFIIAALPYVLGLFASKFVDIQNKAISNGFKYKYQFGEYEMDITLDSGVAKFYQKINYLLVYKVAYFDDVVCIYLNSSVVYMFKLSNFNNDEERNNVMKKIDKNYKVK